MYGRLYDTSNFTCFVCEANTYRARVCKITVSKFPFLVQHARPLKALSLRGGREVAVCRDCHDTLREQFSNQETYGVPLEQRAYNWVKKPPPLVSLLDI